MSDNRKLATVRTVSEIIPIEGADNIELVKIDGWQCIVRKGEFNQGDRCFYFEIDSFLPIDPDFEFLRKSSYKELRNGDEGFRIKTMRMRGQLSQGLVLRVVGGFNANRYAPGADLTRPLKVRLWEDVLTDSLTSPHLRVKGSLWRRIVGWVRFTYWSIRKRQRATGGRWPAFLQKTDQERIQNHPEYFRKYPHDTWEVTTKLDGQSCTFFLHNGEFGICSRNARKKSEDDAMVKYAREHDVERRMRETGLDNFALQGEFCGPKIQKNNERLGQNEFFIFDIWSTDQREYIVPRVRRELYEKLLEPLGFKHVPIVYPAVHEMLANWDMNQIVELARGRSLYGDIREGVVCKHSTIPGLSFKVINNDYLLKQESKE